MAVVALLAAILCSANYAVVDPDTLSRLSLGRYLCEHSGAPDHDPFTFAAANASWSDPEWLGDIGLYELYSHSSERTLQLLIIAIACAGYVLSLALAVELGASIAVAVPLLLCTLATSAQRISARNDVHLLWLIPAFAQLALRAGRTRWSWIAPLFIAWLWSQLHSSFVLAMIIAGAAWIEAPKQQRRGPAIVMLALPVLPLLGLSGASSYQQLYDHLLGARIYHALLSEWMSPVTSAGWLAILPLHVIAVLGIASLALTRRQVRALPLTLFALGTLLAYSSRRFLPIAACAIIPGMGGSFTELIRRANRQVRVAAAVSGTLITLLYTATLVRSAQHNAAESVFGRADGPEAAVRFIARAAPKASRVFNAFDDGPWLLWFERPDVKHYLDPRNNLGADMLARYALHVLPEPATFEAEVQRLSINLALVPRDTRWTNTLRHHLSHSNAWGLVYWDGFYDVYARDTQQNRSLLEQRKYRVLRSTLDLRYLNTPRTQNALLERDLAELGEQSAPLANVIRAYRVLRAAAHDTASARAAATTLVHEWPKLPATDELSRALAELSIER